MVVRLLALTAVSFAASDIKLYICPGQEDVDVCQKCIGKATLDVDSEPLTCINRYVFSPDFAVYDVIGLVAWFIAAGLAMSAGIGGGGIFVPLGALLLRFAPKSATSLSQASIFGASLAGIILNSQNRHPLADRPVIDVDMVLFLAPMEMAGAILGYVIESMCASWFVIVLMVVVLGITGVRTFMKGKQQWTKEKKAKLETNQQAEESSDKMETLEHGNPNGETPAEDATGATHTEEHAPHGCPRSPISNRSASDAGPEGGIIIEETAVEKRKLMAEEPAATAPDLALDTTGVVPEVADIEEQMDETEKMTIPHGKIYSVEEWLQKDAARPTKKIIYLIILWFGLLVFILLKGGKTENIIVPDWKHCTPAYWILQSLSFVWLLGFSLLMGRRAVVKSIRKKHVGFPFVQGDVQWTWRLFFYYSLITFGAGIIAGMIGIGGGMVLGPLMLQLGLLPQVSTASTATMIMLTSSSVAAIAVMQNSIPWSYALTFFCVAFCGALIGKYKIDAFVKKKKLTAVLIFLLAGIICCASLMMAIYGLIKYERKNWVLNTNEDFFRTPCQ
eukprot:GEMP01016584.1.p1 GENE.GEMP01016584.1~~GEMP01016584.1.p1  ORF type:complete len:561 (+),score=103.40 GEMP01016584.1:296-1978(+)